MQVALRISQMLVRITGVLLLILGLLFWTGNVLNLIPLHMLIGLVLVLSLWLLSALAVQAGVPIGLAAGAAALALITLLLGVTQTGLLPGPAHWVIQVLHLLLGIATVGSGEIIGGRLRRMRLAAA